MHTAATCKNSGNNKSPKLEKYKISKSNPKQPSCKNVCSPQGKKDVKSKVAAKKCL